MKKTLVLVTVLGALTLPALSQAQRHFFESRRDRHDDRRDRWDDRRDDRRGGAEVFRPARIRGLPVYYKSIQQFCVEKGYDIAESLGGEEMKSETSEWNGYSWEVNRRSLAPDAIKCSMDNTRRDRRDERRGRSQVFDAPSINGFPLYYNSVVEYCRLERGFDSGVAVGPLQRRDKAAEWNGYKWDVNKNADTATSVRCYND